MDLVRRRRVHEVGAARGDARCQAQREIGRRDQAAVGQVPELRRAQAEHACRLTALLGPRGGIAAGAAVGEYDDMHGTAAFQVLGDRAAAAEYLVVRMRGEHQYRACRHGTGGLVRYESVLAGQGRSSDRRLQW